MEVLDAEIAEIAEEFILVPSAISAISALNVNDSDHIRRRFRLTG